MDLSKNIIAEFWTSPSLEICSNPKQNLIDKGLLPWAQEQENLKSHLLIPTSGTTGEPRWIALSKRAMLNAAQQVNQIFTITNKDVFALNLPLFHVSGLSILARSYLSEAQCCDLRNLDTNGNIQWDAKTWHQQCQIQQVTIISLVPTQVADIINLELSCPKSIRIAFVGGDYLAPKIKQQASDLGWPLHLCYGMTETSAMLAVANKPNGKMKLLPNWQYQQAPTGKAQFKGPALCSGYIKLTQQQWHFNSSIDNEGWFTSDDHIKFNEQDEIEHIERDQAICKILGEKISLSTQLMDLQSAIKQVNLPVQQAHIFAKPHSRRGAILIPTWENLQKLDEQVLMQKLIEARNIYHTKQNTRITELEPWQIVSKFKRSSLNKVNLQ